MVFEAQKTNVYGGFHKVVEKGVWNDPKKSMISKVPHFHTFHTPKGVLHPCGCTPSGFAAAARNAAGRDAKSRGRDEAEKPAAETGGENPW